MMSSFQISMNRGQLLVLSMCLYTALIIIYFGINSRMESREISVPLDPDMLATALKLVHPNCTSDRDSLLQSEYEFMMSEGKLLNRLSDCVDYFNFVPVAAKKDLREEGRLNFAFSHLVHEQVSVLEVFLAVMFRPWNNYCIHVDQKAAENVHLAASALAKCYNQQFASASNPEPIHVISRPLAVFWGHISVLQADFRCLEFLFDNARSWTHFVNVAGTELPTHGYRYFEQLVGNKREGENMMDSVALNDTIFTWRITNYHHLVRTGPEKYDLGLVKTVFLKPPPPLNLTVYKGLKNVVITRNFSNFLLFHPVSSSYFDWLEDVFIPDELYYQTMAKISSITKDGEVIQDPLLNTSRAGLPRFTIWYDNNGICKGPKVRAICHFTTADLHLVRDSKALVANKFDVEVCARAPLCHWKYLRAKDKISFHDELINN